MQSRTGQVTFALRPQQALKHIPPPAMGNASRIAANTMLAMRKVRNKRPPTTSVCSWCNSDAKSADLTFWREWAAL